MATEADHAACARKVGYSRAAAIRSVNRVASRDASVQLKVYRCPACHRYHVTGGGNRVKLAWRPFEERGGEP